MLRALVLFAGVIITMGYLWLPFVVEIPGPLLAIYLPMGAVVTGATFCFCDMD